MLSNPLTRLALVALAVLSLFHWAHRFRHTLYDGLQIKHLNEVIALVSYGVAVAGSVAAVLRHLADSIVTPKMKLGPTTVSRRT